MNIHTTPTEKEIQEEEINIRQHIEQYAYYWKWFVLAIVIGLGLAFMYLRYSTPIYNVNAKILLQDERQQGGELAALSELSAITGGGGGATFVMDQIDIMRSRRIMRKVVEQNRLSIRYENKGKIKSTELLEDQSPIKLVWMNEKNPKLDSAMYSFTVTLKDNGEAEWEDVVNGKRAYQLGHEIETPLGAAKLLPNTFDIPNGQYLIKYTPINKVVDALLSAITIVPNKDKQSYVVNFSMNHAHKGKAERILNSLVEQYNTDITNDKTQLTRATSDFINSRLELISKDLASADSKLAEYKDQNKVVDMENEARLYMQNVTENERKLVEYQTQVHLADMLRSATTERENNLLPTNIGLTDLSIESTIKNYNERVLEREDLLKSATPDNPVVQSLTRRINELNENLQKSLDNYRQMLQSNVESLQNQKNKFEGKLSQLPNQERGFKDISRQQQIVEQLYLFLLQKREETEIKASATPANIKIIDAAYGSDMPVAPKKNIIVLGALIAGFLIPFSLLYLKFLLDNKVQSRKDIEVILSTPILSEIPSSEDSVVHEHDRSALAEAFRILRTNIAFMMGNKKDSEVIYVTSTISGEGKSFVSTNLARILAMAGKKVLLIGADIRSPKVLDYLDLSHLQHTNAGITQYLINPDMDIENLIIKKPNNYKFDIIYSGYVAPNPAELLMNGYFDNIINYGRKNYDVVLVDTAPVSVVTDTLLIAKSADLTLYVTRAGLLDKRLLNIPKELYKEGRLKNMAVVINDVNFAKGYGYGYGYGYGDMAKQSLSDRILKSIKNIFQKK